MAKTTISCPKRGCDANGQITKKKFGVDHKEDCPECKGTKVVEIDVPDK